MGFSRQEYWSGLPFPSLGDFPNPESEPMSFASPALAMNHLPLCHLRRPSLLTNGGNFISSQAAHGEKSAYQARDMSLIPELKRSLDEGNGNPLQYSCLETPMDREAWRDTVQGGQVTKESDMTS